MIESPAMRRKDRQLPLEEAQALLETGTWGVLSLIGEDGWPYAVPMNYVTKDGKLYLHCATKGAKLDAIARDDRACFTVVLRAELVPAHSTTLYESVVVKGRACILTQGEEHRAALTYLMDTLAEVTPDVRDAYVAKRLDRTALIAITPATITGKASRSFIPISQRL